MQLRLLPSTHRSRYLFLFLLSSLMHFVLPKPSMTVVTVTDSSFSNFTPSPNHFANNKSVNNNSNNANDGQNRNNKEEKEGFWLTTELLSADFRKGCLSTALCHEPKFKLLNTMTVNGEQAVISWPANGANDMAQEPARSFVTYWTVGEPEDVALSCQIAGTDPSFGFSRVCDETPSKRVLNDVNIQRTLNGNFRWRAEDEDNLHFQNNKNAKNVAESEAVGRIIVELRGRCFNATLAVRKHLKRCPWCPDLNTHIVVSGQQGSEKDESTASLQQKVSITEALFLHNLLILALSGAIVFGLTGFCCAIAMHCRYRKRRFHKNGSGFAATTGVKHNTKRLLKFAPLPSENANLFKQQQQCCIAVGSSTTMSPPHQLRKVFDAQTLSADLRYETPWDKKYRAQQCLESAQNSNSSHYQTLTLNNNNKSIHNNNAKSNNYDCTAEQMNDSLQHYEAHQQISGSSIGAARCQTRNETAALNNSSSSGTSSNASTSATTIGCGSLGSSGCNGNNCCPTAVNSYSDESNVANNNAIVNISPVVNHPGAAFASLKQNECNGYICGTLSRTLPYNAGNNDNNSIIGAHPHRNLYLCQQYFQAQNIRPPQIPPPLPKYD